MKAFFLLPYGETFAETLKYFVAVLELVAAFGPSHAGGKPEEAREFYQDAEIFGEIIGESTPLSVDKGANSPREAKIFGGRAGTRGRFQSHAGGKPEEARELRH